MMVSTRYEDPEKNQNQNNNYIIVSDSKSDDEENLFDEDIDDEVKAAPKTTVIAKVVKAMKTLQALYNDNAKRNCQGSSSKNAEET